MEPNNITKTQQSQQPQNFPLRSRDIFYLSIYALLIVGLGPCLLSHSFFRQLCAWNSLDNVRIPYIPGTYLHTVVCRRLINYSSIFSVIFFS